VAGCVGVVTAVVPYVNAWVWEPTPPNELITRKLTGYFGALDRAEGCKQRACQGKVVRGCQFCTNKHVLR
jgi:hypothetical protein